MADNVWICAVINCRWCCCSGERPVMGTWAFTTAPPAVLMETALNGCCATGAVGGFGDCDIEGISC